MKRYKNLSKAQQLLARKTLSKLRRYKKKTYAKIRKRDKLTRNLKFKTFACLRALLVRHATYLFIFQLYLNTRARAILFCARALFINLIDVCI